MRPLVNLGVPFKRSLEFSRFSDVVALWELGGVLAGPWRRAVAAWYCGWGQEPVGTQPLFCLSVCRALVFPWLALSRGYQVKHLKSRISVFKEIRLLKYPSPLGGLEYAPPGQAALESHRMTLLSFMK